MKDANERLLYVANGGYNWKWFRYGSNSYYFRYLYVETVWQSLGKIPRKFKWEELWSTYSTGRIDMRFLFWCGMLLCYAFWWMCLLCCHKECVFRSWTNWIVVHNVCSKLCHWHINSSRNEHTHTCDSVSFQLDSIKTKQHKKQA